MDSNTPLEETVRTLDDLVRHGKVRYLGLSNLMSWQASTAVMLQERLGLEKYVTAQMYYSLVGRGLEYEFQSFAEYHNIGILVWSPLAGGFLSGKYDRSTPPSAGTRFAEAGQFVPFDKEMGYRVVDVLKEVARRAARRLEKLNHDISIASCGLLLTDKLTQAILAKAFRGELVPTEAELARREGRSYEPASAPLARIRDERRVRPDHLESEPHHVLRNSNRSSPMFSTI
ncbi:MAG: aldo/keto reductase [Candidatus Acidiferrales bacterium]